MDKKVIRIFFEKKGRAVYISHLDLLRTMQRSIRRSGLPAWYSEGFNPRIYLNFPLALSLGTEGEREPCDFGLTEEAAFEEVVSRLNDVCPEGVRVIRAAYPVFANRDIGFADYRAVFSGEGGALSAALDGFLSRESITVMKHSKKRGQTEVNIKPFIDIREISVKDGGLSADLRLPAGNDFNLNAGTFTDAFIKYLEEMGIGGELVCIKRTNILCSDGKDFE